MTAAAASAHSKAEERRALGVACGAHALHDGYTDLIYVLLPIWQHEFGLGFAALGLMKTVSVSYTHLDVYKRQPERRS